MRKNIITNILVIAFAAIALTGLYNLKSFADNKNSVIMVYNSWSVVSRDLKPVASTIASQLGVEYKEFDLDSPNTPKDLRLLNLGIPTQTPYVVVMKNGNIVFKKAYPSSTPDLLRTDLNSALGN